MGQSHEPTLTPSNLALCVRQMYLSSSKLSAFQRLSDNFRVPERPEHPSPAGYTFGFPGREF